MSQIYFPDALSEYANQGIAHHNERATARDTFNTGDSELRASGGGHRSFCSIKEDEDYYRASLVIGVDRTADIAGGGGTGGPGGGPPPDGGPSGPIESGAPAGTGSGGSLVPGSWISLNRNQQNLAIPGFSPPVSHLRLLTADARNTVGKMLLKFGSFRVERRPTNHGVSK